MSRFSRRSFLTSVSALPFCAWFEKYVSIQPPAAPFVRYNARSAQGKAMLRSYAQAAKNMKAASDGDPTSWLFQWYTHRVNGDTTKAAELTRIYPSGTGPQLALAQRMWNTCMGHFQPQAVQKFFLPWHRMFVYFFERIVRKASGDPAFTLPYWNYSTSDAASHGRLPPQFLDQNDPVNKWLYQANRNAWANQGEPIDLHDPGALDLGVMQEPTYLQNGVDSGFCSNLDGGLHGNVHVDVGDRKNMGSVPYAANDSIFWMHHSNIDRLWASWNQNGGPNPTDSSWLSQQFTFADENGQQVVATVKGFTETAALGYSYEELEPGRIVAGPLGFGEAIPRPIVGCAACRATLGPGPIRVVLDSPKNLEGVPRLFDESVKGLSQQRRLYLVLRDLQANVQPGVLYHVYLELPEKMPPAEGRAHQVGVINFFDAIPQGEMKGSTESLGKARSFDITELAKNLQEKGVVGPKPVVTIAPFREPVSDAKPVIGDIVIFEQ